MSDNLRLFRDRASRRSPIVSDSAGSRGRATLREFSPRHPLGQVVGNQSYFVGTPRRCRAEVVADLLLGAAGAAFTRAANCCRASSGTRTP